MVHHLSFSWFTVLDCSPSSQAFSIFSHSHWQERTCCCQKVILCPSWHICLILWHHSVSSLPFVAFPFDFSRVLLSPQNALNRFQQSLKIQSLSLNDFLQKYNVFNIQPLSTNFCHWVVYMFSTMLLCWQPWWQQYFIPKTLISPNPGIMHFYFMSVLSCGSHLCPVQRLQSISYLVPCWSNAQSMQILLLHRF